MNMDKLIDKMMTIVSNYYSYTYFSAVLVHSSTRQSSTSHPLSVSVSSPDGCSGLRIVHENVDPNGSWGDLEQLHVGSTTRWPLT